MTLLFSTSCRETVGPVRTEIVEVPVEVVKPVPAALIAQEPKPPRPPLNCRDANGALTLCNRQVVDWLLAYDAALDRINARVRELQGLQPEQRP